MRKILSCLLSVFLLLFLVNASAAKKITIKTIPENAKIEVDGSTVGEGVYTLKFDTKNEFYVVKVSAPGYITKKYRVMNTNPNKSILVKLHEDEAMKASYGSDGTSAIANTWMEIRCKKGLKEDIIWKRLMSVCTNYFNNISVRDKSAGWIKTSWQISTFTHQIVRTRLEVRMTFTDEDVVTYRARLACQIKDKDCPDDECFEQWDRVLKKFEPMIEELQTTVGGGD